MKKITSLILVCVLLTAALTGCSKPAETAEPVNQTVDFAPDTTVEIVAEPSVLPEETQSEVMDVPVDVPVVTEEPQADTTPEPEITPEPTQDTSLAAYTFQTLSDTSFGFVFTHPSEWINYPGKHTVCFREPEEDGSFPARVAITKKKMVHTPNAERVLEQFKDYADIIKAEYDQKTFEWGTLNNAAKFMGNTAYEIPYLAYSGNTEIQGYLICTAIDYTVYVFHFYCAYPEYNEMKNLMTMMRDSVKVVE